MAQSKHVIIAALPLLGFLGETPANFLKEIIDVRKRKQMLVNKNKNAL